LRTSDGNEVKKPVIIGIVGTAKNTGKTTTLNCLLAEAERRSIPVAITGIGYDGEEIDNITHLPKPRITVQQGSIVATSERCLTGILEQVQILERTGMFTSLGEIIILRAVRTGMIVVAGPNKRSDLSRLLTMMLRYETGMIIVDGSLNRIAPMSVVQKVIVTTGGSRSEKIGELADELHAIESFFRFPICSDLIEPGMSIPSLVDEHDVHVLLYRSFGRGDTIEIAGHVSLKGMEFLAQQLEYHRYPFRTLVLPDPFTLLMTEACSRMEQTTERLLNLGVALQFRRSPVLSFFTVNPFIPRFDGITFSPSYLDAADLICAVRSCCTVPVFNTAETDPAQLLDICVL
jgi:hypothetical protein